ncbi:CHAT domain-containing protein [Actinosynnema sp. NPDC047251]|nr:CHAT domain-containing protein [Saccharothrix espanaensis]
MGADLEARVARASAAVDRHDLAEAEALLTGLVAEDVPDSRLRCRVLIEWSWVRGARGDYPAARSGLTDAVALAERAGHRSLECEALRELGIVLRYQGEFRLADDVLARAVRTASEIGDFLEAGQAQFGRATIAHHLDQFAKARECLVAARRAAAAYQEGGGTVEQAELLLANICREEAVSARIARDFDAARALLEQARERYAGIGRRVGVANALRELGAVLDQVGDEEGARRRYGEAFAGYLRAGRRLGAAAVARRLGFLDLVAGSLRPELYARAETRLRQALRLAGGEPTNRAVATRLLGQVARLRGRLAEAEALLAQTEAVFGLDGAPDGPHRGLSAVELERGFLARDSGRPERALEHFTRALALLDQDADRGAASIAHHQIARQHVEAGRIGEALPHAVASFTLDEDDGRRLGDPDDRRSFYLGNNATYALAMRCAVRAGDGRTALVVATAARSEALAAFVRAGARLSPGLSDLVARIALITAEADPDGLLPGLYRELEHATSTELRQALSSSGTGVEDVLSSLPPGGHALLLDVMEDDGGTCTRVWLRAGQPPLVDEAALPGPVLEALSRYADAVADVGWDPQNDDLALLGEAVIPAGLAAELAAAATPPPLVVSTGGLLGPVPVAAVRVGGRFLAELAQLSLVPSFPLWIALRSRPRRPGTGVLAFLDPGLPGAAKERRALDQALAPVTSVPGDRLRAALAAADRFSAVVVSAHGSPPAVRPGTHIDGAARAGLAQALSLAPDDQLTAADLLTASLPEAFITASCWTGRVVQVVATEPFGLPTAALLAGARWVLAGSVDVGGAPAARIMASFYGYLRDLSPAAALHRAQVDYLAWQPAAPPSAWASLCIIGDGYSTPAVRPGDPEEELWTSSR